MRIPTTHTVHHHHPFYRIAGGAFFLLLWVAGSTFTLLTDQSLLQGGNGAITLSWEVLKEPWYLITGQYSGLQMVAILGAFLIYGAYVYLSFTQTMRGDAYSTIVWVLITFDGIANFQYFHAYPQMPLIYQCMLTGLIFMTLVHSGSKGLELFMSGINDLRSEE